MAVASETVCTSIRAGEANRLITSTTSAIPSTAYAQMVTSLLRQGRMVVYLPEQKLERLPQLVR